MLFIIGFSALIGCYYQRTIEFIPSADLTKFENWHIDVYMKAYAGPSKVDLPEQTDFFFFVSATTILKYQGGGTYRPSKYEAKINSIKIYFGENLTDKSTDYEWDKGDRSNQDTSWSPIGNYLKVPTDISELTIVANVDFLSVGSTGIEKEFVVKMKRRDEDKMMFEGI